MPLLDHFHPPLAGRRHWEAFHSRWASAIADALNVSLPRGYFAEEEVHAGPRVEVDVATWQEDALNEHASGAETGNGYSDTGDGGVATLTEVIPALATADLTIPITLPPEYGVRVYATSGGPTLVAAVELVSPGNKDRDETRRAFAAKCAAYVQRAVGLIVVDVVTDHHSRPFDELMAQLAPDRPPPATAPLTAVSYRPVRVSGAGALEVRVRSLAVGAPLPELPLALGGLGHVMLNLETTYEEARTRRRL